MANEMCIGQQQPIQPLGVVLIDIIGIIICLIITNTGYKKLYPKHHTYTYIIKPTRFSRQLATNAAICGIAGLLFKISYDLVLCL